MCFHHGSFCQVEQWMVLSFWSGELYGCWNETIRIIDTDSLSGVNRSRLCDLKSETRQAWKHEN